MNNKGFTLIELLVVVLIIGILAAIALPQYTKAVERSRTAEAMQHLGDLATAQSIYFMVNNSFAGDIGTLNGGDITVPALSANSSFEDLEWIPVAVSGTKPAGIKMAVKRRNGMYGNAELRITVRQDGSIEKECKQGAADGLCGLAAAGGYTTVVAS